MEVLILYTNKLKNMSYTKKPKYIDWDLTSSNSMVTELVVAMYVELKLGTQKVSIKTELLKTVLMNLLRSARTQRGVMYPRSNSWFQSILSKYKYPFVTYDLVINLTDALLREGFITHLKGSWDMAANYKEQSIMNPSVKLLEFYNHLPPDVIEYSLPVQEVLLRNITIEEELNENTGKTEKKKKKVLLDYTDTTAIINMRKVIREWNYLRKRTFVTLDIPKKLYYADENKEILEYYCDLTAKDNKSVHFKVKPKGVYRVFRKDFEHFGRYSAGIETMVKREYRPTFKINGEPTIELDFQALHIRMLYNMESINYPGDPYQIAAESYKFKTYRIRKYFKMIGLMAINADTKTGTIKALRDKLKNEIIIKYPLIKKMLEHWLTVHKPIEKYLCSGIGLKLMYKDSCIAEKVIQHFTSRGIFVMCVHDSFIISKKYKKELKAVMEKSYKEIMWTKFKPVIDVK